MIFDEFETLKILGNKFVYFVPNVSVFGDFYNLRNLEIYDLELIQNFIQQRNLVPGPDLSLKVNNTVANISAEFFTKIVSDGSFYVEDIESYDILIEQIDDAIETLEENDIAIFQQMVNANTEIPINYFDPEFEFSVNNDPSGISRSIVDELLDLSESE